jgi:hypothetical protein
MIVGFHFILCVNYIMRLYNGGSGCKGLGPAKCGQLSKSCKCVCMPLPGKSELSLKEMVELQDDSDEESHGSPKPVSRYCRDMNPSECGRFNKWCQKRGDKCITRTGKNKPGTTGYTYEQMDGMLDDSDSDEDSVPTIPTGNARNCKYLNSTECKSVPRSCTLTKDDKCVAKKGKTDWTFEKMLEL